MIRGTFLLILLAMTCAEAFAFKVMPSLNCYKTTTDPNAVERVAELKSDGAWFITQNSDFTDTQWQRIFKTLGGRHVSEDNPDASKSYDDYLRISETPPTDAMCYNETGGPWRTETDRCLKNPKVRGICMEYVKEALLENINAPAEGIRAILAAGKRVYILLHADGDGWTLEENKRIIENLNAWCPEGMANDEVYLVYQNYHAELEGWFGPGGVKEAIDQACGLPNYMGARNK